MDFPSRCEFWRAPPLELGLQSRQSQCLHRVYMLMGPGRLVDAMEMQFRDRSKL